MAQPRIVVSGSTRAEPRPVDHQRAWKFVAIFSALLAFVALADFVLAWVPLRFGVPEWEFATVAQTLAGLPLLTIGLAGLLGSAIALGRRGLVVATAVLLLVLGLTVFAALVLFLLDVPLALRASQGPSSLGVQKAIVKTLLLGVAFGSAYVVSAIAALRRPRRDAGL